MKSVFKSLMIICAMHQGMAQAMMRRTVSKKVKLPNSVFKRFPRQQKPYYGVAVVPASALQASGQPAEEGSNVKPSLVSAGMLKKSPMLLQQAKPNIDTPLNEVKQTRNEFSKWLEKQDSSLQESIKNHEFIKTFDQLLSNSNLNIADSKSEMLLRQQVLQIAMKKPKKALSVMNFYMNMNKMNRIVKKNVLKFPQEFQDYFARKVAEYEKSNVGKYINVRDPFLKLKLLIISMYPVVVTSIKIAVSVFTVIIILRKLLKQAEKYDMRNDKNIVAVTDEDLIEAYNIICAGLGVPAYPLLLDKSQYKEETVTPTIHTLNLGEEVLISDKFFKEDPSHQIRRLFHVIKHVMQFSPYLFVDIDQELVETFIKDGVVEVPGYEKICNFILRGTLYTGQELDIDANVFAIKQILKSGLTDSQLEEYEPFFKHFGAIVKEEGKSAEQAMQELFEIGYEYYKEENMSNEKNVYLKYIPRDIKAKAAKKGVIPREVKR